MKKITYPILALLLGSSVACTNMTSEQQGTVTGAGIGALAGAGIAGLTGGNGWTGAAIGAVAGGGCGCNLVWSLGFALHEHGTRKPSLMNTSAGQQVARILRAADFERAPDD